MADDRPRNLGTLGASTVNWAMSRKGRSCLKKEVSLLVDEWHQLIGSAPPNHGFEVVRRLGRNLYSGPQKGTFIGPSTNIHSMYSLKKPQTK